MNTYAQNYLTAVAALEVAIEEENELEEKFLADRGYSEKRIFTITDDEEFDKLNNELGTIMENNGFQARRYELTENKVAAEEALINFALSIVPEKEKAILEKAAKSDWKTRQQIIDLAIRYNPDL